MEPNNRSLVEQYNDEYRDVVLPVTVFIGIEAVIGFFGNLLVIYVFLFRYHVCNFRYFVLCLASVDFIGTLTMPAEMFTLLRWFTFPDNALCKIKSYLNIYTFSCETFCLLIIAIDRYRKLCVPVGWQIKPRVAYSLCLLINVVAAIIAIPVAFLWGLRQIQKVYKSTNITLTMCEKDEVYSHTSYPLGYVIPLLAVYAVCFVVMIVLYIFVARKLRHIGISGDNENDLPHSSSGNNNRVDNISCSTDGGLHSKTKPDVTEASLSSERDNQNEDNPRNRKESELLKGIRTFKQKYEHSGNVIQSEGNKKKEMCSEENFEEEHTTNKNDEYSDATTNSVQGVVTSNDQNKKVMLQIQTHSEKMARRSEHRLRKITLIMLILTLLFIILGVCYRTMMIIVAEGDVLQHISNPDRAAYFFIMRLYFINHVINPIVYYVLDSKFRKEIKNIKSVLCCAPLKLPAESTSNVT